ncbi:hypothetical protein PTKIN_Ptkin06aG0032200 [Pterospermum kingtungense]
MERFGSIEEGYTTSRHRIIPETFQCLSSSRKKSQGRAKRAPSKNGYFQPPNLNAIFTI